MLCMTLKKYCELYYTMYIRAELQKKLSEQSRLLKLRVCLLSGVMSFPCAKTYAFPNICNRTRVTKSKISKLASFLLRFMK